MKILCVQTRLLGSLAGASSQRGVVLIVGLIIVLLISIVALAAIRGSGLQEAISGNMRDRTVAFQSAESAVVEAEQTIDWIRVPVAPQPNASIGLYDQLSAALSPTFYDDAAFSASGILTNNQLDVESQPIYVIEQLPIFKDSAGEISASAAAELSSYRPYRATIKGVGLTPGSQVIIQTTYNRLSTQ